MTSSGDLWRHQWHVLVGWGGAPGLLHLVIIVVEVGVVLHAAIVFGELHGKDDRGDEEEQAPANRQPEAVL